MEDRSEGLKPGDTDEGARETSIPLQCGERVASLGSWNVAEEAASFQTQRRLVLHVVGITVGVLPSIGLGRECYVLRSRVIGRVPRVLVLLLVWHPVASLWRRLAGQRR
jgi:hypothetical protein